MCYMRAGSSKEINEFPYQFLGEIWSSREGNRRYRCNPSRELLKLLKLTEVWSIYCFPASSVKYLLRPARDLSSFWNFSVFNAIKPVFGAGIWNPDVKTDIIWPINSMKKSEILAFCSLFVYYYRICSLGSSVYLPATGEYYSSRN